MTGPEIGKLSDTVLEAFEYEELERLLKTRLDRRFWRHVPIKADYEHAVFKLVDAASRQGWIAKLLAAMRAERPGNSVIFDFAERFQLTSSSTLPGGLAQQYERIVQPDSKSYDVAIMRQRLGIIESCVCRIEIATEQEGTVFGTGFLVGPRTVLTNHHVIDILLLTEEGKRTAEGHSARPEALTCRFDYKRILNDKGEVTLFKGAEYRLSPEWKVDLSPSHPLDQLPPPDRLDYAVLRLNGTPGNDVIAPVPGASGPKRGWLELKMRDDFAPNRPLFIIQHPKGDPLKLAFEPVSIIGVNENATRVRYRTNTKEGSSGSPCFNADWELVAMHHSGDPDFYHDPRYNEGIPISAIIRLLEKRGLSAALEN